MWMLSLVVACGLPDAPPVPAPAGPDPAPLHVRIARSGHVGDGLDDAWDLDAIPEIVMSHGPAGGWTLSLHLQISGHTTSVIDLLDVTARDPDGHTWFELLGHRSHRVSTDPDDAIGWIEDVRLVDARLSADEVCAVAGQPLELAGWAMEPDSGRETPIERRTVTAALDLRHTTAPCE